MDVILEIGLCRELLRSASDEHVTTAWAGNQRIHRGKRVSDMPELIGK